MAKDHTTKKGNLSQSRKNSLGRKSGGFINNLEKAQSFAKKPVQPESGKAKV